LHFQQLRSDAGDSPLDGSSTALSRIKERRAINLDANCGWARGKADVVYVADAFAVMEAVNKMMGG
jgi:hypothetical protein